MQGISGTIAEAIISKYPSPSSLSQYVANLVFIVSFIVLVVVFIIESNIFRAYEKMTGPKETMLETLLTKDNRKVGKKVSSLLFNVYGNPNYNSSNLSK